MNLAANNLTSRLQELLKIRIGDANVGRKNYRNDSNNNSMRGNNKSFGSCANSSNSFNNTDDNMVMVSSSRCDNVGTPYNYHRFVECKI